MAATNSVGTAVNNTGNSLLVIKDKVYGYLVEYGFNILGALVILAVGHFISGRLSLLLKNWLDRREMEPPVKFLLVRVFRLLLLAIALLIALGTLKVNILPLVAGLSVLGVGVGLAMQGALGNLVAGLLIIFTKPFRIGEFVELLAVNGQVHVIELFSTTLLQGDQSRIVIPNRKIIGEILRNYGQLRQASINVGVSYETDLNRALEIIKDILDKNPRVLKTPAAGLGIATLADSSIVISVKPFTDLANFGPVGAEVTKAIVERFRAERIQIPAPMREIRILPNPDAPKLNVSGAA